MPNRTTLIAALLAATLIMPAVSPGETQKPKNPEHVVSTAAYEDNQIVQALIEVGDRMVAHGEIADAIETYQQALEDTLDRNPSALIETGESTADKLAYYRPCLDVIRERMMRMNDDDVAVYRQKYESSTAHTVRKAIEMRDMEAMLDISRRRPYTVAGIRAAEISADVAMENTDFALAAEICGRTLEIICKYPKIFCNTGPARAAFYARAAAAYAASGNKQGLDRIATAVAEDKALGAEKILIDGKPTILAARVDEIAKAFEAPRTPITPGYPMLGGDDTRAAIMGGCGGIGSRKWHYEVEYKDRDYYGRQQKIASHILIPPIPTASGGRIYLNTGYGMVALSEYDGTEIFGASLLNPDQPRARLQLQETLDSCTVRQDLVYFVETTGATNLDIPYSERIKLSNFRRLVAVDAKTGRRVWDTDTATKLDKYDYVCGSPAVYRDTILFQVMRHTDVTDSYYMVSVDALTGDLRWRIPLVSKAAGKPAYSYRQRSPNIIAIKGDTAVATSSTGTVTAVNLTSRTIKWGVKFHNDEAAHWGRERSGDYRLTAGVYCANQPMLTAESVILKPSESRRIYCLDINTGRLRWLVEHPTISYIAGIDGDSLFAVGPGVKEISVKDGSVLFNDDYKTGVEHGSNVFLLAGTRGDGGILGRPALTEEGLYVSTVESLFRFDRKTKKIEKLFDWEERDLLPGNLLMTENGFYIANSDGVTAFYTPAAIDAMTKLLEKTPGDPALLYRRGMTRLGFGKSEGAIEDLELAAKNVTLQQMLNGQSLSGLIREGLMESCMAQAQKDSKAGKHDSAVRWATRAIDYASQPSSKTKALCNLAELQEIAGPTFMPAAVESWQRIVEEHPDEFAAFGQNFQQTASLYATVKIAADIKKHGRGVYAEVEKRASAEMAAAKTRDDFQRVLDRYPNSLTAFGAITKIAGGSDGIEMSLMTPLIGRCDVSAETAPFIARFYRLAWACGETHRARAMLDMLAQLPGGVKIADGGVEVSVADFVKAHLDELAAIEANDPTRQRFAANATLDKKVLETFPAIMEKRRSQLNFAAPTGPRPAIMKGRLLLRYTGYLYCVDTATGNILWLNPGSNKLWLGMSVALAKTGQALEIVKIFPDSEAAKAGLKSGDRIVSLNGRPAISLAVWRNVLDGAKPGDDIQVEYIRNGKKTVAAVMATLLPLDMSKRGPVNSISSARYVGGNRVVAISSFPTATARCIDLKTGRTLWQSGGFAKWPSRTNAGLLITNGLFVAHAETKRGSRVIKTRLTAVDLETGKVVARIEFDGALDQYALAGDVFVVRRDNLCTAYGLTDGKKRYEFKLRKITINHKDYVEGFRVAADRILLYADLNDRLRSIDLWNGRNVCEPVNISRLKLVFNHSERYVMAHSHRSSFGSVLLNNVINIFDGVAATGKTKVEFIAPLDDIEIRGDRIFAGGPYKWTRHFCAYDIKTGVMSEGMKNKREYYDFKSFTGEYVVMGKMHRIAVSAPGAKPGAKSPKKREIRIKVFDANGKEYFSFTTPTELVSVRITGFVVDGNLCLLLGKRLYVFKSAK